MSTQTIQKLDAQIGITKQDRQGVIDILTKGLLS